MECIKCKKKSQTARPTVAGAVKNRKRSAIGRAETGRETHTSAARRGLLGGLKRRTLTKTTSSIKR